jgi:hypothetical protein
VTRRPSPHSVHLGTTVTDMADCEELSNIAGVSSGTQIWGVVAIYLVGGCVNGLINTQYHFGCGQCDELPTGHSTFIFIHVASFLQVVAPLYCAKLNLSVYGQEKSGPDPDGD